MIFQRDRWFQTQDFSKRVTRRVHWRVESSLQNAHQQDSRQAHCKNLYCQERKRESRSDKFSSKHNSIRSIDKHIRSSKTTHLSLTTIERRSSNNDDHVDDQYVDTRLHRRTKNQTRSMKDNSHTTIYFLESLDEQIKQTCRETSIYFSTTTTTFVVHVLFFSSDVRCLVLSIHQLFIKTINAKSQQL